MSNPGTEAELEIARLRARVAELEVMAKDNFGSAGLGLLDRYSDRIDHLESLLRDVRYGSGVEFNDERLKYLSVRIDRTTWEAIGEAVGDE